MLLLVAVLVFLAFIILFIVARKRDKPGRDETKALYARLDELKSGIIDIGKIQTDNILARQSQTSGDYVSFNRLTRIFKYENARSFWVEFVLQNDTEEELTFFLQEVNVSISGNVERCDLTLLIEKVPEYVAPPYGNQYFDTNAYNNFILGSKGPRHFEFQSRFILRKEQVSFKSSDYIQIEVAINKSNLNPDNSEGQESCTFIESFSKMKFPVVQSIDDVIKWETGQG